MICLEEVGLFFFFHSFLRIETGLKLCLRHKAVLGHLISLSVGLKNVVLNSDSTNFLKSRQSVLLYIC